MRYSFIITAGMAAFLAACSPDANISEGARQDGALSGADPHDGHHMGPSKEAAREKREFVETFVDHFDVQECQDSELIGTMRRSEPDGSGLYTRAYQISVACTVDLKAAFEARGFDEIETGRYVGETTDGTIERVVIRMADDGSRAGVEWEVEKE